MGSTCSTTISRGRWENRAGQRGPHQLHPRGRGTGGQLSGAVAGEHDTQWGNGAIDIEPTPYTPDPASGAVANTMMPDPWECRALNDHCGVAKRWHSFSEGAKKCYMANWEMRTPALRGKLKQLCKLVQGFASMQVDMDPVCRLWLQKIQATHLLPCPNPKYVDTTPHLTNS